MKHIHSAGIIIYRTTYTIEYLVLKYSAGHWDFAKGKMEDNETKEQAALRELLEETGLTTTIDEHFEETFSYIFNDYDGEKAEKTVSFFLGQVPSSAAVTLSDEHSDYRWLSYEDARNLLTYDNAKDVLDKAHRFESPTF
jgi:8-oxo-dGTP pyrophosphatase MutT (NUDIX family)